MHRDDWTVHAKCRGTKDALFPEASEQKRARQMCSGCPVRYECLAEALDNRIEWGVWGGMTERERRLLLRQRTDVTSWRSVLVDRPAAAARGGRRPEDQAVRSGRRPEDQSGAASRLPIRRRASRSVTSLGSD